MPVFTAECCRKHTRCHMTLLEGELPERRERKHPPRAKKQPLPSLPPDEPEVKRPKVTRVTSLEQLQSVLKGTM